MVRFRKMRVTAYLISVLMLCMYITPSTQALADERPAVVKQKVIAFPFAVSDVVTHPGIGEKIPSALVECAHTGDAYEIVAFSKRHPSLQRAILVERTMSEKDLTSSFGADSRDSALKIAREMRGDLLLIGDVESYKYDQEKNQSEVLISAVILDVRNGKVVKNMAIAGATPENSRAANEDEAAALATGNAVTKVAEEVGMKVVTDDAEFTPPVVVKKSNKKKVLLWSLILGLGLGIAVGGGSSSGGSDNGGGGFEPPPDYPM